jgi:hypothetical protein
MYNTKNERPEIWVDSCHRRAPREKRHGGRGSPVSPRGFILRWNLKNGLIGSMGGFVPVDIEMAQNVEFLRTCTIPRSRSNDVSSIYGTNRAEKRK